MHTKYIAPNGELHAQRLKRNLYHHDSKLFCVKSSPAIPHNFSTKYNRQLIYLTMGNNYCDAANLICNAACPYLIEWFYCLRVHACDRRGTKIPKHDHKLPLTKSTWPTINFSKYLK